MGYGGRDGYEPLSERLKFIMKTQDQALRLRLRLQYLTCPCGRRVPLFLRAYGQAPRGAKRPQEHIRKCALRDTAISPPLCRTDSGGALCTTLACPS